MIGKDIPYDVLAAIAEMPEAQLNEQLHSLQAAEFLFEVSAAGVREYTFKHNLTQVVAYDSMLRRLRRDLHARVLAELERSAADRLDELTDTLTAHAMRGEVWDRAVALAMRGGARANARSAWKAAVGFFDQALEALSHLPESEENLRLGIDIRLGQRIALGPLIEIQRALTVLEEAAGLALRLGDTVRVAQIDASRCVFQTIMGHLDDAIAAGRRSVAKASELPEPTHKLNAAYALAQAHWFAGNFDQAEAVLEENLPILRGPMRLRSAGTSGSISVLSLVCLSKTYAITGMFDHAQALAQEAQHIAAETGKPYDLTYGRVASGFAHIMAGEAEPALAELTVALDHCRRGNIPLLIPSVARYLGRAYALMGHVDAAHELLEESLESCRAQSMTALTIWCGLASGHAHLEGGAHDDAADRLAHILELARRHVYRPAEAHAWHLMARSRLAQGDIVSARKALDLSAKMSGEMNMRPELSAIVQTRSLFPSG